MSRRESMIRGEGAKCFGAVLGLACLAICTVVFRIQFESSGGDISGSLDVIRTELDGLSYESFSRRLLSTPQDGFTPNSSITGIRGALVRKPATCSSPTVGNLSVSLSEVDRRVEHLRCALELSSTRVRQLLNRKALDPRSVPHGLPRKFIPKQYSPTNEVLDSNAEDDSYESDSWASSGEYLMQIKIGTPARTLKGILDTGSDLTWIQCLTCVDCYKESDPIYDPIDSSTYEEVYCDDDRCEYISSSFCDIFDEGCDYLYTYTDTSYTYGTVSEETFTLESTDGEDEEFEKMTFGCSHGSSGSFMYTRADGVVGFGKGKSSLPSQLANNFGITDRFSYCLVSRTDSDDVTSPVYFGDAAALSGDGVSYTDILTNDVYAVYYYFSLKGISVAGERLDLDESIFEIRSDGSGGTIIDSGTTVTNLIKEAYEALVDAFNESCEYESTESASGYRVCYDVGDDSDPEFPSLEFHMDGVDLNLPQGNYMVSAEEDTMCLAIDESSEKISVYGNVQQQNYHILYDRENSRLGFQHTQCDD